MIGRLQGRMLERGEDGTCVLDVSGVGYEVHVPVGALARLPVSSSDVTLFVHTHVREDALTLYGFDTADDRFAFRTMLGVSGVGPKIALAVLSGMTGAELAAAVATGNRGRFRGISGVGKKTVERLVLELRDKLTLMPVAGRPTASRERPGTLGIVASALVQLGYKPVEVERALAHLGDVDGRPVERVLKDALGALS